MDAFICYRVYQSTQLPVRATEKGRSNMRAEEVGDASLMPCAERIDVSCPALYSRNQAVFVVSNDLRFAHHAVW